MPNIPSTIEVDCKNTSYDSKTKTFVVEASTLGLPVGQFPGTIIVRGKSMSITYIFSGIERSNGVYIYLPALPTFLGEQKALGTSVHVLNT